MSRIEVMDTENAVAQIMGMGFSDETKVRKALSRAHNNVSDAISLLTGGSTQPPDDVEMDDVKLYGEEGSPRKRRGTDDNCNRENWDESLPPYDGTQTGSAGEGSKKPARESRLGQSSDIEFPLTNLYELEERLNAESWSVPLKNEESLGKCLFAAIRLANEGLADTDEGCARLVESSLHSAFEKLHMSYMVCRWGPDVQLGIMDMTFLLVKFMAAKLKHGPVPVKLLGLLSQTFDPDSEFHYKNRAKPHRPLTGDFDCEPYAVKMPMSSQNEPYGWLVTLINTFGIEGGVHAITHRIENSEEKLDAPELAALLSPFGKCAEFLYPERMKRLLNGSLDKALSYVQTLSEDDFKRKETGQVSDLFATLKLLFRAMWTSRHVDHIHELRLETSWKMLQTAHFNAKMNALKEISKLVEESQSQTRHVKSPIPHQRLLQWMKENEVLETALEGNLHQSQYSDRVKTMMELLGSQLSKEQLTKIWAIQVGKHPIVIENIHAIMAAAAVKFDTSRMDQLFDLIQETWGSANDRHREKLLGFVGKIGRDDKHGRIALKVLDLLWNLSQLPQLPHEMVQQALHAHSRILSDSTSVKDDVKKLYAQKCIENIKKSVSVLPSLRHLQEIIQGMKTPYHKVDKSVIQDLQKQYDLIKLGVTSLVRCHREAVAISATMEKELHDGVVVNGFYTHAEYVKTHLKFLGYILNAGLLYIGLQRVKDIWDCLVSNPDACESDAEVCFDWFVNGMTDMQPVTQTEMFEQRVLQVTPENLTCGGYNCFKVFFENVNMSAGKMRRSGMDIPTVDSHNLLGRDYLWRIALENPSEEIAQNAVDLLLQITYISVCNRLKREPVELHTHFIDEISRRLDEAVLSVRSLSPLQHAISLAATAVTAPSSPAVAAAVTSLPDRLSRFRVIERLLLLAEQYISTVESSQSASRNFPCHGATFRGELLRIQVHDDQAKNDFTIECHSNETLISLRRRLASRLKTNTDRLQVYFADKLLLHKKDYRLLYQLGFQDQSVMSVKVTSTFLTTGHKRDEGVTRGSTHVYQMELEREFPSHMMSKGKDVFTKLYQFADLGDPRIAIRVRSLLMLLPNDPDVVQAYEQILDSSQMSGVFSVGTILQRLLTYKEADMTTFRVLYSLEVLSGYLMPTTEGISSATAVQFRTHFLKANGHRFVISLLQSNVVPDTVDYEVQQEYYLMLLRIIWFLLCGPDDVCQQVAAPSSPLSASSNDSGTMLTEKPSEEELRAAVTMSENEFLEAVVSIMHVAWAAATGQLPDVSSFWEEVGTDIVVSYQPGGVVLPKDALIAKIAIELFVKCFLKRGNCLSAMYQLPNVSTFIIDVLLTSPAKEIRKVAVQQFHKLAQTPADRPGMDSPRKFFLHVLLNTDVPLWTPTASIQGHQRQLLDRCTEYFEMRCCLLNRLSEQEQESLQVKPDVMLEEEINWLDSAIISQEVASDDHTTGSLLAGHLKLIATLFTCHGVDKRKRPGLVQRLLDEFLFPASTVMLQRAGMALPSSHRPVSQRCSTTESQEAAHQLLVTLAEGCADNLKEIVDRLITIHHSFNPEISKEWEFQPPVAPRAKSGFVGLKNGGATCYMNSVIQQLYMQPAVIDALLGVDDSEVDEDNTFFQMQQVFAHLLDSQLEHYVPERFWQTFKLWGNPVNIREQQDAFEFFSNLTDQLDSQLKKKGKTEVFQKTFSGMFTDQIICKDCPHRYERKEAFWSLQLNVKSSHTLQEALQQFVKGEVLEKDNAYFCEQCNEKRDATKRLCIKTLPESLVIHLKRFGYDWEEGKALKCNDHFSFPWAIDMAPYTAEALGLTKDDDEDAMDDASEAVESGSQDISATQPYHLDSGSQPVSGIVPIVYELVGIVVHSGQAHAGHYYSFIKDKRGPYMKFDPSNPSEGRWYRFSDTVVEEFGMNDTTLETECFGGQYKSKTYNDTGEPRIRSYSAYMLFYKAVSDTMDREHIQPMSPLPHAGVDGLSQLTALVQRGERRGIFSDRMPVRIQRAVEEENLKFMQNRDVFNQDYFRFIKNLILVNLGYIAEDPLGSLGVHSIQLAAHFLFHTYFHTQERLRKDVDGWSAALEKLLQGSAASCNWLIHYLGSENGYQHIRPLLLECPNKDIRTAFASIVHKTLESHLEHGGSLEDDCDNFLEHLLDMLEKDVPENWKTCAQYIWLVNSYAKLAPPKAAQHLLSRNAFTRILCFLMGATAAELGVDQPQAALNEGKERTSGRRWPSHQSREFGQLHSSLFVMISSCDLSSLETVSSVDEGSPRNPYSFVKEDSLLALPKEVKVVVALKHRETCVKEVVAACCEVPAFREESNRLVCCLSWRNEDFTYAVLAHILHELATVPSNELKPLFQMLHELMLIRDHLQLDRLQYMVEESQGDNLLVIVKECSAKDSKRAYQCIKFLVSLANQSRVARQYLVDNSSRWFWAVNWLKKQMTDYYWTSDVVTQVSNESSQSTSFQRTISAQDTLEEATALLSELEKPQSALSSSTGVKRHRSEFDKDPDTTVNGDHVTDLDSIDD